MGNREYVITLTDAFFYWSQVLRHRVVVGCQKLNLINGGLIARV
jgi:hypothetical protein